MRKQEVMSEVVDNVLQYFLILSIGCKPGVFHHGFISKSGKSFVMRKIADPTTRLLTTYIYIKIDPKLLRSRIINHVRDYSFKRSDLVQHEFNGVDYTCVKINVTNPFKKKNQHDNIKRESN